MRTVKVVEASSTDLGDFTIQTLSIEYESGIILKVSKNVCNRCGKLAERVDDLPASAISCPCTTSPNDL